jgi:hypothetical protein
MEPNRKVRNARRLCGVEKRLRCRSCVVGQFARSAIPANSVLFEPIA